MLWDFLFSFTYRCGVKSKHPIMQVLNCSHKLLNENYLFELIHTSAYTDPSICVCYRIILANTIFVECCMFHTLFALLRTVFIINGHNLSQAQNICNKSWQIYNWTSEFIKSMSHDRNSIFFFCFLYSTPHRVRYRGY